MDILNEKRHQIYKKRYPYKPALAQLKIIEENETRASYYKKGSIFYAPNYEKWKEAVEALTQMGYTAGQVTEIKEAFRTELASVAKARRELKKEETLIDSIFNEKNRVQAIEITAPKTEAAYREKKRETPVMRKGGDAEKTAFIETKISAHTDADYLEKQPAYKEKQKQPEQAR